MGNFRSPYSFSQQLAFSNFSGSCSKEGDPGMGILKKYVNQTRNPEGFLGKLMVANMNGGHAKLADWGLEALQGLTPKAIVELGCGGGRNAGALLKRYPDAALTAIDYSAVSVEKAKKCNQAMIAVGRCTVKQGDVSRLELPSNAFDLATAFETVYFWPGLERCFAQAARVLIPGGHFLIVNESNGEDVTGKKFEALIDGMTCYTGLQLDAALKKAGFVSVRIVRHPQKPWIAVLAEKG